MASILLGSLDKDGNFTCNVELTEIDGNSIVLKQNGIAVASITEDSSLPTLFKMDSVGNITIKGNITES